MEVDAYADSLKALSNIIKESNKILNGKEVNISVEISATKAGSIIAFVTIYGGAAMKVLIPIVTLIIILKNLGFDTESFAPNFTSCLKKIRERKKKEKQELGIDSEEKEDFESFPREIRKLCESPKVTNGFCEMVKPVRNGKVKKMSVIRREAKKGFSVDKNNVHLYDTEQVEEVKVRKFSGEFKIKALSFEPQGKWKLYNDETPVFTATIEDQKFLRGINENEEFFLKDSKFICQITEKQNSNTTGQKSNYYIKKIKSKHHIQGQLPFVEK